MLEVTAMSGVLVTGRPWPRSWSDGSKPRPPPTTDSRSSSTGSGRAASPGPSLRSIAGTRMWRPG